MSGQSLNPGAGAGRRQVALAKGHSMMDWIRLGNRRGRALAGARVGPITPEELERHSGPDGDIWMAIRGRVYNITPYMDFHPGGRDELLRGSGMDATALFNEVHAWVNFESMLEKCFLGPLVPSGGSAGRESRAGRSGSTLGAALGSPQPSRAALQLPEKGSLSKGKTRPAPTGSTIDGFKAPLPPGAGLKAGLQPASAAPPRVCVDDAAADASRAQKCPLRDWYQTASEAVITVYSPGLSKDAVSWSCDGAVLQLDVVTAKSSLYRLVLALGGNVDPARVALKVAARSLSITVRANPPGWLLATLRRCCLSMLHNLLL